jgi:hypothetical protein
MIKLKRRVRRLFAPRVRIIVRTDAPGHLRKRYAFRTPVPYNRAYGVVGMLVLVNKDKEQFVIVGNNEKSKITVTITNPRRYGDSLKGHTQLLRFRINSTRDAMRTWGQLA